MALTAKQIQDEGDDYWIPTHDECIAEAGGALYEVADDDSEMYASEMGLEIADRWIALAAEIRAQTEMQAIQFDALRKSLAGQTETTATTAQQAGVA